MSKKTRNILLALYIVALSTLVTGATFAFFTVIKVSNVSPRLDVETANLNFISFDIGNPIFINPTVENFKEGMDSLSDSTFASAFLRRDQGSEKTMVDYNVLLNIEENTLTYSTSNNSPELLIKVIGPSGEEIKEIEGLNYVTVTDNKGVIISGFDITTKIGTFYITKNRHLETESEVLEKWNAEVTYVNLSESQDGNLDKKLNGYIRIEKAE